MLMKFELMQYATPVGDFLYHFTVDGANRDILKKALTFNESYKDIYGHPVFDNVDEIKNALKSLK